MRLIYLSADNLAESLFIKNLVHHYKLKNSLLIHDHFGKSLSDTKFVTKRISALLSENMVVNNAFNGDQRNIFSLADGKLSVNSEFISERLHSLDALLINPIAMSPEGPIAIDALQAAKTLLAIFDFEETLLFPSNPRSAMVAERVTIRNAEDFDRLISLYDEERKALETAIELAPAILASSQNFSL